MPFTEGNNLGGRKKGSKSKVTVAKELLFNNLWDEIGSKITNEGVKKCWNELMTLEGKDYVSSFMGLLEYFKPKLQRSEHTGKDGGAIETSSLAGLSFEQLYMLKYGTKPTDNGAN